MTAYLGHFFSFITLARSTSRLCTGPMLMPLRGGEVCKAGGDEVGAGATSLPPQPQDSLSEPLPDRAGCCGCAVAPASRHPSLASQARRSPHGDVAAVVRRQERQQRLQGAQSGGLEAGRVAAREMERRAGS
jgi:hypothetical protein